MILEWGGSHIFIDDDVIEEGYLMTFCPSESDEGSVALVGFPSGGSWSSVRLFLPSTGSLNPLHDFAKAMAYYVGPDTENHGELLGRHWRDLFEVCASTDEWREFNSPAE